jgi:hypothetical protein
VLILPVSGKHHRKENTSPNLLRDVGWKFQKLQSKSRDMRCQVHRPTPLEEDLS